MKSQQLIIIFLHCNYKADTCILHLDATIRCTLLHVFAAVILPSAYPLKGGRRGLPELMAALPHAVTPALPPDLTTRPCEPNVNRFVFVVFWKAGTPTSFLTRRVSTCFARHFQRLPVGPFIRIPSPRITSGRFSSGMCVCVCACACRSHTTVPRFSGRQRSHQHLQRRLEDLGFWHVQEVGRHQSVHGDLHRYHTHTHTQDITQEKCVIFGDLKRNNDFKWLHIRLQSFSLSRPL